MPSTGSDSAQNEGLSASGAILARTNPMLNAMNTDRERGAVLGRDVRGAFENVAGNAMDLLSHAGRLAAMGGLKAAAGIRQLADDVALELGIAAFSDSNDAEHRFQDVHDHAGGPARPLRIGLIDDSAWPEAFRKAFEHSAIDLPVRFESIAGSSVFDAVAQGDLDAAVAIEGRGDHRMFHVATRVLSNREPGQHSWEIHEPGTKEVAKRSHTKQQASKGLAFSDLFPLRLDCGSFRVKLSGKSSRGSDAPVLRALTDMAALLSRHPARLDTENRLTGRRPINVDSCRSWSQACVAELASSLAATWPKKSSKQSVNAGGPSEAASLAANVLTAWLCSDELVLEDQLRRAAAEVAGRALPTNEAIQLRLAAVRIATGNSDEGLEAIAKARTLRSDAGGPDSSSFITAELNFLNTTPLALGRAAAGIYLTLAGHPSSRLSYLRDDLNDDIRACEHMLFGGEEEQLLKKVMDMLAPAKASKSRTARRANNQSMSFASAKKRALSANARQGTKRRKAA
jgi:hypothetical protein